MFFYVIQLKSYRAHENPNDSITNLMIPLQTIRSYENLYDSSKIVALQSKLQIT